MQRPFLAALTLALAAATAPAADAHPGYHYEGGCSIHAVSDGGDSYTTQWIGYWSVYVQATDAVTGAPALVPIEADCEIYLNGVSRDTIGLVSGTGTAARGHEYTYEAAPDDVITVCTRVTVRGENHTDCGDVATMPVIPEWVQDGVEGVGDPLCPWVCVSVRDDYAVGTTWPI